MPSLLDVVVKTTKISRSVQATRVGPSDGAGTVWFQFGTVHCGTIQLNQTKEVPVAKVELGVESQPPPKQPFLTVISKIARPT